MEFQDYYKVLGVATDADLKAVKTAYRKLARKYHPDVSDEHDAEKRFKEVAEAYEVISDETKRAEYDQLRKYGRGGQPFEAPPEWQSKAGRKQGPQGDFSDFFENIFGSGGFERGAANAFRGNEDFTSRRGRDVEVELPLLLEDTFSDEARPIEYLLPHYGPQGRLADIRKTLKVKIPAGVIDGERIRLKGQGGPGFGDGPAGDLFLRIRLVPHPLFDIAGADLNIVVPIAPWEAALGVKLTLPTLTGKINLSVTANSQSGQRLRIKGKGMRTRKEHGDLFAVLKIVMPERSPAQAEALWQELAEKAEFNPRKEWESS